VVISIQRGFKEERLPLTFIYILTSMLTS